MTSGLMRRLFSSSSRAQLPLRPTPSHLALPRVLGLQQYRRSLTDGRSRRASVSRTWFTSSTALHSSGDHAPPEERKLKLGKAIRTLHESLPTLLSAPLPQDILSPQISLHLFPSTHPHLPTVSGKIAYTAALWTAPVAWGRVPVVGNVKLKILSERMEKSGRSPCAPSSPHDPSAPCNERLVVKWSTCGKTDSPTNLHPVSDAVQKITSIVGGSPSRRADDEEFSGLFLFEFDTEGRIARHTIEHVEEGGLGDGPTKVISVTDWLLGRAWRRREEGVPSLAYAKTARPKEGRRSEEER